MVSVCIAYAQAGWVTTTATFLAVCVLSSLASTFLIETMERVRQRTGRTRLEFAPLAEEVFNGSVAARQFVLWVVVISSLAANIPAIIVSSQVMDGIFIRIFGKSCAVELFPTAFSCATEVTSAASPFVSNSVLSLGMIATAIICVPLGLYNLEDSIGVQVAAFFALFGIVALWICQFFVEGLVPRWLPAFGDSQTAMLGTVIFNFAFVISVPSWANESKSNVNKSRVIWTSTLSSTAIFILLGVLGTMAFRQFSDPSVDLLSVLSSSQDVRGSIIKRGVVYGTLAFPAVALISGIPVFSILARYNLLEAGMGPIGSSFISVILPWVISVAFYGGSGVNDVINWLGLVVGGMANFVLPTVLYIKERGNERESVIVFDRKPETQALPGASRTSALRGAYAVAIGTTLLTLAAIGANVYGLLNGVVVPS